MRIIYKPLCIIVLMGFIISFSVVFTLFCKPVHFLSTDQTYITKNTHMNKEDITSNYNSLIKYNTLFANEKLTLKNMTLSKSMREHLVEVRKIMTSFQIALIILSVISVLIIRKCFKTRNGRLLIITGGALLSVGLLIGLIAATLWDYFFSFVHEVFFSGQWQFDIESEPLLRLLPNQFFVNCTILIVTIIVILSIASLICGIKLNKSQK